ncbi:hypothetical protein C8F04DRAFT_1233643 [Mycena alexandri]|uniref:Uncharacterized protein n=1 Tax=Mycena alexandri TaxID=1745969 RepID=A0AAD6SX15_9AGAR|nr:hypothetical protein C8F04DRAFT_1233643 [Mycena alexandri]
MHATTTYPMEFQPNFFSDNAVTINRPLSTVFTVLGTDNGLERGILLSTLASGFQTLEKDNVAVAGPLEDAFVRTATAAPDGLPRQRFQFKETVKIIPGLSFSYVEVNLRGTLTWDETRNVALYETTNGGSILVKKVRKFEEVDGSTKVSESIYGQCPAFQKLIVQLTTAKAHRAHMNLYHTLFE